ncbi:probable lysine decarboxylase [Marinomonas sp. MED121]|nr:probable lysine decarboxylase [Marinomonas sp. MED121]
MCKISYSKKTNILLKSRAKSKGDYIVEKLRLPIYESLRSISKKLKGSFHALPIQNIKNSRDVILSPGFVKALEQTKNLELSITGPFFDSLTDPSSFIDESCSLLKNIYSSDSSLLVSCGSSIANKIAIEALCNTHDKVICQNGVHQSIYFSLKSSNINVNYIDDIACKSDIGVTGADANSIIENLKQAEESGTPYSVLIVNSQTYDGICFDFKLFLEAVCQIAPNLEKIILDEAWGAWSAFDPLMKETSAIHNARIFSDAYNKNIVVIHSLHKTLFTFRQASLINFYGNSEYADRLIGSHFRNHTTSPSYPILCSSELAIFHANEFGKEYSERSRKLVDKVRNFINENLSGFEIEENKTNSKYLTTDPTKLWITCKSHLFNGEKIREHLFNNYGIYISRYFKNSFLLNFHYGVNDEIVEHLINSLLLMDRRIHTKNEKLDLSIGDVSESFFILYPPGIPVLKPGQRVCENALSKINQSLFDNTSLLVVDGN